MMPSPERTSYDAIIVGARVAGAATALLLARAGLRVLAIDRGRYGTDTLSTHALMRGAVLQLAKWQILSHVIAAGTPLISRTRFHYGAETVQIDITPRGGVPGLAAPRRHLLDRLLVDHARSTGAEIVYGASVVDLSHGPGDRVQGLRVRLDDGRVVQLATPLVIGADGLRSAVARMTGAPVVRQGQHAGAVVYGYWPTGPSGELQWLWGPGMAGGVVPTNDGESCVFAAVPASRFAEVFKDDLAAGYWNVLTACTPAIAEWLRGLGSVPRLRGFAGATGSMRRAVGAGWALVGDAGYFKDPITAHGITDALRDAELLSRAIVSGREGALDEYQEARDTLSTPLFDATEEIASFEWSFDRLAELHRRLSDAMKREVEAMTPAGPTERMTA